MPEPNQTPGVYVQEVSSLPPGVQAVGTSTTAFLGYTEKHPPGVHMVRNMDEFRALFGGPDKVVFLARSGSVRIPTSASLSPKHGLYFGMELFFHNGGGPCYVRSAGAYNGGNIDADALVGADGLGGALADLDTYPDISLLSVPELPWIATSASRAKVVQALLRNCGTRGDRFAILDVYMSHLDDRVAHFRNETGSRFLSYGAAYYPRVHSILPLSDSAVAFDIDPTHGGLYLVLDKKTLAEVIAESKLDTPDGDTISEILRRLLPTYRRLIAARVNIYLSASPAVAAAYGRTDASRGVWKAPANVPLHGVKGPLINYVSFGESARHSTTGKDINEIRVIEGRGAVVWGARTLAGTDLEYRYVPVRRLMIQIEQSLKRATEFAVFEPNDANTWLKLRNMCENFLAGLWRQGALTGAKPEQAFQVRVGLGQTMSAEDILQGKLRIEIAVAPVRPAEFIVLQFSHHISTL